MDLLLDRQMGSPVSAMKAAVCRRSSRLPYSFGFTGPRILLCCSARFLLPAKTFEPKPKSQSFANRTASSSDLTLQIDKIKFVVHE